MLAALSEPANAAGLDGTKLTWPWALPFAGLLLSIAIAPLLAPKFWHAHYGKVALMWSALADSCRWLRSMAPPVALAALHFTKCSANT